MCAEPAGEDKVRARAIIVELSRVDVADGDRDAAERNRDQGACPQGGIVAL